jgi:hypothetical protein
MSVVITICSLMLIGTADGHSRLQADELAASRDVGCKVSVKAPAK